MYYDTLLFGTLFLAVVAAVFQMVIAFVPRFSLLAFCNALLLFTVFVPLATNRLTVGTQIGYALWFVNFVFLMALFVRWTDLKQPKGGLPVIGSIVGLLAFGSHVFIFSACP
jgi:hypothetical protein